MVSLIVLLPACSTTSHLPEGEQLYIGQKPMIISNPQPTTVGETALEEVEAAIRGTDCTFSAFVVAAVRAALDDLAEQAKQEPPQ